MFLNQKPEFKIFRIYFYKSNHLKSIKMKLAIFFILKILGWISILSGLIIGAFQVADYFINEIPIEYDFLIPIIIGLIFILIGFIAFATFLNNKQKKIYDDFNSHFKR